MWYAWYGMYKPWGSSTSTPVVSQTTFRILWDDLTSVQNEVLKKNMVFQILYLFSNNAPVAALWLELKLILASEMKICMTCGRQKINALKRCFWCWKYQTHSSVWWQQMPTQPSASDSYCNSVRLLTWKGRLSIPHSPTEYSQTILLAWNILFGLFSNPCSAVNGLLI